MRTKEKPRIVEMEITLDAPPEEVWQALTDPEVLTRWFPLEAKVEPGPGGSIFLGWGPEIQGASGIQVWEPGKRLKVAWFEQGRPRCGLHAQRSCRTDGAATGSLRLRSL